MGQYDDEIEIFWASGACFFIRSVVYRELRGFDDDFAHQEEIDLCWRAINKGYSIKYNYKSTVYHVGGATLQQGNPKKTF
jgi:GT2 family glycosyltransferase